MRKAKVDHSRHISFLSNCPTEYRKETPHTEVHKHCPKCNACLITGFHVCVPTKQYDRINKWIKEFKSRRNNGN